MTQPLFKGFSEFSIANAESSILFRPDITLEVVKNHLRLDERKKIALFAKSYDTTLDKFKRVTINPASVERSVSLLLMVESKPEEFLDNFLRVSRVLYPHQGLLIEEKSPLFRQKIEFAEGHMMMVRSVCIMFLGLLHHPKDRDCQAFWER